jgi:exonuclease III
MRLVSWNVAGRRKLAAQQIDFLGGLEPQVVALQEVRPTTAEKWQHGLSAAGLPYSVTSPLGQRQGLPGARRTGVLTASTWPVIATNESVGPWNEKVLATRIDTPGGLIDVVNVHVPPGSSNGWVKVEVLEAVFDFISSLEGPRVLTGDFNLPQEELEDGTVVTWAQTRRANGTYSLRPSRGARWDSAERNIMEGLPRRGLSDAFRSVHGAAAREYSWYSLNRGKRVGRRFDHVFASQELPLHACRYIAEGCDTGLSDHSPIVVDFRMRDRVSLSYDV